MQRRTTLNTALAVIAATALAWGATAQAQQSGHSLCARPLQQPCALHQCLRLTLTCAARGRQVHTAGMAAHEQLLTPLGLQVGNRLGDGGL